VVENNPQAKFKKNSEGLYEIYNRFSFDDFFRLLLNSGFENEDALAFILSNCALSAIVFQERIHNEYYLEITPDQKMSDDLQDILNQTLVYEY